MIPELPWEKIDPLIEETLKEDFGEVGDLTTGCTVSPDATGRGELVVRERGVMAGLSVAQRVFQKVDVTLSYHFRVYDGTVVQPDTVLGSIEGVLTNILRAERTALNFLQRLSGIATLTAQFVHAVRGTEAKILDTRKTTPQLRLLEKYAVRQGGGENHRFGLYDMVLIKDNHIDAAGGITQAVERCLECLHRMKQKVKIEVEARSLEEVREALRLSVHRIMLDNMDVETMRKAVGEIDGRMEVEASGNVSLENVRTIAETGVDYISVGALTHSARALDISLRVVTE